MKTIEISLYKFSELNTAIQDKIINKNIKFESEVFDLDLIGLKEEIQLKFNIVNLKLIEWDSYQNYSKVRFDLTQKALDKIVESLGSINRINDMDLTIISLGEFLELTEWEIDKRGITDYLINDNYLDKICRAFDSLKSKVERACINVIVEEYEWVTGYDNIKERLMNDEDEIYTEFGEIL